MTGQRLCACGCGAPVGDRPNRRYVNAAHRTAAWKARTGYSVQGVQKASLRRKSEQRRRSGRQISYAKAVRVLAEHLASEEFHWVEDDAEWTAVAEHWLRDALPEAQR